MNWIKLSDQAPPLNQRLLVCSVEVEYEPWFSTYMIKHDPKLCRHRKNCPGLMYYWYDESHGSWYRYEPTHWSLLPEPPKD